MQVGIIGLPNAGKSTLFNALTKAGASEAPYPFTTIEPNVGMVVVPDARLEKVAAMAGSAKTTPAHIKFLDIAGLVRGSSRGEGLGNKFLGHIRETDALAHVVRCFADQNVAHVEGRLSPAEDIDIVNLELMLADLATVEKRLSESAKKAKAGDKDAAREEAVLIKARDFLDKGRTLRSSDFTNDELSRLRELKLLTLKPVIYVANIGEEALGQPDNALVKEIETKAAAENAGVVALPAELEEEIGELSESDAAEFMKEMGVTESPLDAFVKEANILLKLLTFFTANPNEASAWTVSAGTKAPQAAGKVHTNMAKGFIRAEVVGYEELEKLGSVAAAREHGALRVEGREYVVQDGDIIFFRFAV